MKKMLPDIILERYILGELSDSNIKEIDEAVKTDPDLKTRIARIKDSNSEILSKYPARLVATRIKNALPSDISRKSAGFRKLTLIPVFGAAAAVAFILFAFPINLHHPDNNNTGFSNTRKAFDITRFKGDDSRLYIFRKTESEPEQLSDNSSVHEGDIIQIVYQSQRQYGVIFSIDGKGNVTLHYPNSPGDSSKTEKGKKVYLQKSYQLDNAPEFERFFFVSSDVGVNTDYILMKARSLAKSPERALKDPLQIAGTKETSITLRKE